MGKIVSLMSQNVLFGVCANVYLCIREGSLNAEARKQKASMFAGLAYEGGRF
jgi:hypothetical protein